MQTVPGRNFLTACPDVVQAKVIAVLRAVAAAPPPAFSGGGYWEAMHDDMKGWFEVRVDGPNRRHYRLLLERDGSNLGLGGPSIVIITGKGKPFKTVLAKAESTTAPAPEHRARRSPVPGYGRPSRLPTGRRGRCGIERRSPALL